MNKKVLIGMPCGSGFISAYTVEGLYRMNRPIPTALLIIERQAVDVARNFIIEKAIELDVDYILFADDDGVLPQDTLEKLLECDKDVVGAPMMTRAKRDDGKHGLCCFEAYPFDIGDGLSIKKYRDVGGFDTSETYLHQVDAIGGACMLIKKHVFTKMSKRYNGRPFKFIEEVYNTKEKGLTLRNLSEDLTFSERLKNEGFEIWVDTRVRPVHLGKPHLIRFEQEGENWGEIKNPVKGAALLSGTLKSL